MHDTCLRNKDDQLEDRWLITGQDREGIDTSKESIIFHTFILNFY